MANVFTATVGTGASRPSLVLPGLGATHGSYTATISETIASASDAITRVVAYLRVPAETIPTASDAVTQDRVVSSNPSQSLAYYGLLYSHNFPTTGSFKQTLSFLNKPALKMSINGGYSPIQLELATNDITAKAAVSGDILRVFEQGGDGSVVFQGIVEDVPDTFSNDPSHCLSVSPMVVDMGDTLINLDTTVAGMDIGTMAVTIVNSSAYCRFDMSKGNYLIGSTAKYKFDNVSAVDAMNEIVKMLGETWYWFCDATGLVSLVNANMAGSPAYRIAMGADYSVREYSAPATALRNFVTAIGGIPPNATAAITATYNGTGTSAYGKRALIPPLTYPNITDQTTLNQITNTVGAALNREQKLIKITLPAYSVRFTLARSGGATVRYFEPNKLPYDESFTGAGAETPTYVIVDIEIDGTQQVITVSDLPQSMSDLGYLSDMQQYRGMIAVQSQISINQTQVIVPAMMSTTPPSAPS